MNKANVNINIPVANVRIFELSSSKSGVAFIVVSLSGFLLDTMVHNPIPTL